jgi:hypothetical protein
MDFGTYSPIVIGRALEGFVLPVLSRWALDLGLALPPGTLVWYRTWNRWWLGGVRPGQLGNAWLPRLVWIHINTTRFLGWLQQTMCGNLCERNAVCVTLETITKPDIVIRIGLPRQDRVRIAC